MAIKQLIRIAFCAALCAAAIQAVSSAHAADLIDFAGIASPGTVIVRTSERRLYLVLGAGKALRYPVGVGRVGRQWTGTATISGKYVMPNWAPPDDVRRDRPNLPDVVAGGTPANPMGAAAMTLSGGQYAIHGTNAPASIGHFVSYGCIRMQNRDITDLFGRVSVGTPVLVVR